jgi:hypothetical protein
MSAAQTQIAELEYSDHLERLRLQEHGLANALTDLTGVEGVLQWMQRSGLGQTVVDLVGQDEFTYDFLLDLRRDGKWLAFGVT